MNTTNPYNFYEKIDKYTLHSALGGASAYDCLEQNRFELNALCHFIHANKLSSWLEIGISHGYLQRFMRDEMRMVSVGITPDRLKTHDSLQVIYGYSQQPWVIKEVSNYGTFDMIFVDGDHSYEAVKSDYANYRDKCRFMAFHDACGLRSCTGVSTFLQEISALYPNMIIFQDSTDFRSGIAVIKMT